MTATRPPLIRMLRAAGPISRAPRFGVYARHLHMTPSWWAMLSPNNVAGAAPAKPPPTPEPAPSDLRDRLERKKRMEALLSNRRGGNAMATRFWRDVHVAEVEGGYQIRLDHRPVRTPNRDVLTIPASKPHLAHAIALEWDLLMSAKQALKNHLIPLTSLVARAGDVAAEDAKGETMTRQEIVQTVLRFLDTDTLLTWAPERSEQDATLDPHGESLRQLQIRTARPITAFLATRVWPGTEFRPVLESDSILPVPQAPETVAVVRGWISSLPPFELAGLERAVLASKSLLVAVRLVVEWSEVLGRVRPGSAEATAAAVAGDVGEEGGVFGIEEAAQAATLEVGWQTSQWGEVEDTHDVDREDVRRQLGSTVLLISGTGGQ